MRIDELKSQVFVKGTISAGDARVGMSDVALERGSDMIVLGTRGAGVLRRSALLYLDLVSPSMLFFLCQGDTLREWCLKADVVVPCLDQ